MTLLDVEELLDLHENALKYDSHDCARRVLVALVEAWFYAREERVQAEARAKIAEVRAEIAEEKLRASEWQRDALFQLVQRRSAS